MWWKCFRTISEGMRVPLMALKHSIGLGACLLNRNGRIAARNDAVQPPRLCIRKDAAFSADRERDIQMLPAAGP